jgi:THO complex subunit 1
MEIADSGLPFTLLEELFDTQTIPSCERLFNYLETRVERLTAGMDGGKGKALVLLRLCNELLRRLSKAEDTIFCGRILIFLSKSYPISERSAVNLRGDFNVDNVTSFDHIPDEPPQSDVPMEVDGTPNVDGDGANESTVSRKLGANGDTKRPEPEMSTDKLYTIFWSMQHAFVDPTRLFNAESFQTFREGLAATMKRFKSADDELTKPGGKSEGGAPVKRDGGSIGGPGVGEKRKREDEEEIKGEGFNPKYLTSRELFELEVRYQECWIFSFSNS